MKLIRCDYCNAHADSYEALTLHIHMEHKDSRPRREDVERAIDEAWERNTAGYSQVTLLKLPLIGYSSSF